jgi:hypothetical protein
MTTQVPLTADERRRLFRRCRARGAHYQVGTGWIVLTQPQESTQ